MRILFINNFIFFLFFSGISQEIVPKYKNTNQVWAGYFNSIIVNEKWNINSDLQYRTKDWVSHPSLAAIRIGIVRKINEQVSLTAGFAHFRYYISDVATKGELRPWEEISFTEKYKKIKITQRLRIEQRFNQQTSNGKPIDVYVFNWRFRYRLDLQLPVAELKNDKKIYVIAGNEIMINAGKSIKYNYFDQNRTWAGISIELAKNITLQPQFIYIWQQESNGITLDKISVIRLNILHKIKL